MKLGKNFFKKGQSIWGKPMIVYDQKKMNTVFSKIETPQNQQTSEIYASETKEHQISLETELYLMLHLENT